MKQHLPLILIFYKAFWIYTLAVSLGIWYVFGSPLHTAFLTVLPAFLLAKLATHGLVLYLMHLRYAARLYFYTNLGLPVLRLYLISYTMDILLFLLLMTFVHLIF